MAKILVCGKTFDVDVVVFDKDGCLFESQTFWKDIAKIRYEKLAEATNKDLGIKWLNLVGIKSHLDEKKELVIEYIDPTGTLAVAPPYEEVIVCATIIQQETGFRWPVCRDLAKTLFDKADDELNITSCAKPKKGFPNIFDRLHKANIPFGVATSDTLDRVKRSLSLHTSLDNLSFIITSADVKNNKPHRETLDLVASKFNCETSKIMMIGDSFVDVEMAKNAGAIGVGIPEYDFTKEEMKLSATVIAESFDDIVIVD